MPNPTLTPSSSLQKVFTVHGEIMTPVHIGNTHEHLVRDENFVSDGTSIHVIDALAAIEMKYAGMEEPPDFGEDFRISSILEESEYAQYAEATGYSLALTHHPNFLRTAIKTPENMLYIPGSSLKGALRTAFMNGLIRHLQNVKNPEGDLDWYQELVSPFSRNRKNEVIHERAAAAMETRIFRNKNFEGFPSGRDIFRDLFRHILVRDSSTHPISGVKVELYSAKTGELKSLGGGLDLTYEALAPETAFTTEIVWQEWQLNFPKALTRNKDQSQLWQWLRERGPDLRFEQFLQHCRTAVTELLQRERDFYARFRLDTLREFYEDLQQKSEALPSEQALLLPLGWGTGWRSKTLAMLKLDAVFETWLRSREQLNLRSDEEVYPRARHVVAMADEPLRPMGWVKLTFRPARLTELREQEIVVRNLGSN